MKKKVILTQKYQDAVINQLNEMFNLIIVEGSNKSLTKVLQENPDTEAIISFLSDKIDKKIMNLGNNLKIIANYAVGYNNIDVEYAKQKGIMVTNTPDILTNATADFAMTLLLACARRLVEGDQYVRQDQFKGWGANLMLGKELNNATLGIVGMGRIGLATTQRAMGFGMKIIYYDHTRKENLERELGIQYLPFKELIQQADIVSVHIPSSPENRHLFNKEILNLMKTDAIFINVSRGDLIDEVYLAEKLERNELFSAGLDVYEFEPKVTEKLKHLTNVVLAPHLGSATYFARKGMAQMTLDNVNQVLSGKKPANIVSELKN